MAEATDSASVTVTVTEADTARALGSGDVEVLGTPRALALAEAATVRAAAASLAPGQTTVGTRVELDHLAPSPVGATVRADAELVYRSGRRLTFDVRLTQDGREVAAGRVVRAIVDRDRFLAQASTDERG
ncbi:MAG TPA: hotdog domain-containing protein [Mycobacteriales bacterium]